MMRIPLSKRSTTCRKKDNFHLHFPTDKDSKALDRGEEWVFARGAVAEQWVCEQKVEVLDKNQKGQRSWGLLWGLRLMLFDKTPPEEVFPVRQHAAAA